jgi:hypothetical protein
MSNIQGQPVGFLGYTIGNADHMTVQQTTVFYHNFTPNKFGRVVFPQTKNENCKHLGIDIRRGRYQALEENYTHTQADSTFDPSDFTDEKYTEYNTTDEDDEY